MKSAAPLPEKNGLAPSYIWLPEGQWNTLLDFLSSHFPHIEKRVWQQRFADGEVRDAHGALLQEQSPAKRGMCVFYYRELEQETPIPFQEHILFQDEHLLVVDKPHFLPVTPSGRFVNESLLVRLKKKTGISDLSPIHRLDRETAGVMLFSTKKSTRGAYQALFQQKEIKKTYHALAPALTHLNFPHTHTSRMEESEHFLIMHEVEGSANSETYISVLEKLDGIWLYQLQPVTGKKHQLRVHLSSLGAPILNDAFYPIRLACKGDDFSQPLQLLAKTIRFIDPITQAERSFSSLRTLEISST
jgi:tRNA pseudouridine32 synthase/23S rRNA pseudouridine746 synthase